MGFISKLIDRFTSRFTRQAGDKLADKAVNKLFGNGKESSETTSQNVEPQTATSETVATATTTGTATPEISTADLAKIAMLNKATAGQGLAQANEFMNYLVFNDEMEIIGVKDDAPDYLKIAYKNGKLTNKE